MFCSFSSGNNPNNFIISAITVTDNTEIILSRYTKNQKPLFFSGMIRVIKKYGIIIIENSGCLLKRDSMLFDIDLILIFIPFKIYHSHN